MSNHIFWMNFNNFFNKFAGFSRGTGQKVNNPVINRLIEK